MKVRCPKCGGSAVFTSENPFRPFCSERCQTLDLGAWADEQYKVPVADNESTSVNKNSDESDESDESSLAKH